MDLIKQKFDQIVKQAQALKADVELLLSGGESLSFGFQKGKVDSFKNSQTQMAGFRVIKDGKQGYAYTENLLTCKVNIAYQDRCL
jgi:PmbA protein